LGVLATEFDRRKVVQTWSFRRNKSRNKVSVGDIAKGSLRNKFHWEFINNPIFHKYIFFLNSIEYLYLFGENVK